MKKRLGILFLGLVVLIVPLMAQDTLQTGSIEGVVVDTSGSGLPGVTVTISGEALIKKNLSTTTSTNGEFRFSFLPVGKYDLTFSLPGFKTTISKNVEVTLRKTTLVRITMEVSPVEETVTVLGESPVVDLKTYTVSANFTKEVLQKLPSSRDPWVIMEMTPGVVMDRQNVGGSTAGNPFNPLL